MKPKGRGFSSLSRYSSGFYAMLLLRTMKRRFAGRFHGRAFCLCKRARGCGRFQGVTFSSRKRKLRPREHAAGDVHPFVQGDGAIGALTGEATEKLESSREVMFIFASHICRSRGGKLSAFTAEIVTVALQRKRSDSSRFYRRANRSACCIRCRGSGPCLGVPGQKCRSRLLRLVRLSPHRGDRGEQAEEALSKVLSGRDRFIS